jgi:hypothetical protein
MLRVFDSLTLMPFLLAVKGVIIKNSVKNEPDGRFLPVKVRRGNNRAYYLWMIEQFITLRGSVATG